MSPTVLSGATVAGLLPAPLAGDFVLQSHWTATRKTTAWWLIVADNTLHLIINTLAVMWL
jgi:hypothetical protein